MKRGRRKDSNKKRRNQSSIFYKVLLSLLCLVLLAGCNLKKLEKLKRQYLKVFSGNGFQVISEQLLKDNAERNHAENKDDRQEKKHISGKESKQKLKQDQRLKDRKKKKQGNIVKQGKTIKHGKKLKQGQTVKQKEIVKQDQTIIQVKRESLFRKLPSIEQAADQKLTYCVLNKNYPLFTKRQKKNTKAFERYSSLDNLGRCGTAFANLCPELMPVAERGEIGNVHPSGWRLKEYPGIIEDNYLYNRCHLIGYQLAGENANEKNLITGTRYFNVEGMLPFENQVATQIKDDGGHVLYRVTPVYRGKNLLADGVEMEAYSVEDHGKSVCFHVFVYNIQPEICIDYANGNSWIRRE